MLTLFGGGNSVAVVLGSSHVLANPGISLWLIINKNPTRSPNGKHPTLGFSGPTDLLQKDLKYGPLFCRRFTAAI